VLVFTRKLDEAIVIGDGIEIKVLRIGRDGVRIGVTAPASVPVHRLEVYDQIRTANTKSAADADAAHDLAKQLVQETGFPRIAASGADGSRSKGQDTPES
jgi:carbon storage regulator